MTNAYLDDQRRQRIANLYGKFVIVQDSRYSVNTVLYLQDTALTTSHKTHWTQFMANARGFDTMQEATNVARNFKYNNVRVIRMS